MGLPRVVPKDKEYLPLEQAARLLDATTPYIQGLIKRKLISVLKIPGCRPRVRRSELMALAEKYTVPAERRD